MYSIVRISIEVLWVCGFVGLAAGNGDLAKEQEGYMVSWLAAVVAVNSGRGWKKREY